jgi:DNA invertase Pin-like site-specific DNA recombinase
MKAIIYARFSTDMQDEQSIFDQVRVCRAFAAQRSLSIGGEFSDEGISGAATGNRPGVQAALAALSTGDVLVVMDLTRLCRSQDLAPMLSRLKFRGVRVFAVQDGFDSDSRTARMQAGMSGIMSEEFRTTVADRTRSALEMRALAGRPTGGKAYDNREIVEEVFRRYADGETLKAIVHDLNRREIPSPGANWKPRCGVRGKWLVSALHAILKNEKYIGRVVWNKSQWFKDPDSGKRVRRERPREQWIVQPGEAWVDEITWSRVQRRFVGRTKFDRTATYPLSGLLECGICEKKMVVFGGKNRRYGCSAFKAGGEYACTNSASIPRKVIEAAVLEPLIAEMLSPEAINEGVKMLRIERAKAERELAHPETAADREVAALEAMVRAGTVSADIMAPAIAEAKRRALAARTAPPPTVDLPWPTESAWRAAVSSMREILNSDDIQAARDVLKRLVGKIRCTPDERGMWAEVHWYNLLLAVGGGRGIHDGSGGVLRRHIPRNLNDGRSRPRKTSNRPAT